MAEKTSWDKVKDSIKRLSKLHDRQDEDEKLAYMDNFFLTTYDGKQKLDNVINITGNRPVTFAEAIVGDLESAVWQTVVEGDIAPSKAREIEEFINYNFEQADELLESKFKMGGGLKAWLCNHVCIRSLIGVRWISQIVDGEYSVDCLPVDMRWCAFPVVGEDFYAPIFFTHSNDVKELYPFDMEGRTGLALPDNKDIILIEFWDSEKREVWIKESDTFTIEGAPTELLYSKPHKLGTPPLVVILPSTGFMLRSREWLEHEAESIFWKNRKLYKELNRQLSIEQTLGMDILYPPYEREVEPQDYDSMPAEPVPKSGEVGKVRKGERAEPVPRGDLNRASLKAIDEISAQIETGGISNAELGATMLDRPGVWFARQFEIRHKLEKARFEAIASMKAGLARMMIKQTLASSQEGAGDLLIGRTGKKIKFNTKTLANPDKYHISFRYMTSSKEMEIINIATAQAAKGIVPDRIIVRDILKAEDPVGWERELELDKAKQLNPAIGLAEMAVKYAEEAERTEDKDEKDLKNWQSMMLVHEYVMQMEARMQPPQQPTPEQQRQPRQEEANLTGLASMGKLLGAGGLIGGGQSNRVTQRAEEVGQ